MEQTFVGNVVVTDNVVFVSSPTRLYAIDIRRHRVAWSAPTPGTVSITANRMLFVAAPTNNYDAWYGRITAYRLH